MSAGLHKLVSIDSKLESYQIEDFKPSSHSFGILGKPLSQFSCTTLMPQGANTEDEEDDEDDDEEGSVHVGSSKTSSMPKRAASTAVDKRGSASRANTGVSRATTEGVSSDTE